MTPQPNTAPNTPLLLRCPFRLNACLLLALFTLCPSNTPAQPAPPAQAQTTPADADTPPTPPFDVEREKRELRLMLHTSIVILIAFFLAVALFTLIRVARRYHWWVFGHRHRSPTPCTDAWKQHRLTDQHYAQTDEDT